MPKINNSIEERVTAATLDKDFSITTTESTNVITPQYTLKVGKDGEERLNILNELYNPLSMKFLKKAGIAGRKKLLDVACGTGEMTCWMAQQTTGKVIGIDISEKQIEIATQKAKSLGIENIEFIVLSAFELNKLTDTFDFIYCRFLLVHIQQPEKVLASMFACLKNDGIIACEEATASVSFCYPSSAVFDKWLSLWAALRKAKGTDLDLGLKLPRMFRAIGCTNVSANLVQPVLSTSRFKSVLRLNTVETTEAAIEAKFETNEGMSQLVSDLAVLEKDDDAFIGYVRNSQVWGRKHSLMFSSKSKDEISLKKNDGCVEENLKETSLPRSKL